MKANELDRGLALIALGNKRKYCSNILSSNVACSVLTIVWMDHWKGSYLDVSVWRCFNWREPFGRDKVWWNYLEVTTWKLSNSEGKVTFGSRVHWGASLFRRHHWERNHWEMGNVSLWGRVTFGARAIERRQSGGESGAREAIVLHPGDISCTQLNHTWLENIFLENFTTIIDEVNLLHTNKQLYINQYFEVKVALLIATRKKIQSFCWHSVLPNTKKTQLHNLAFQHGGPYKQCPGCQEEKYFLIRLDLTLLDWGHPISKCQYPLVIERVSNWAPPAQNSDEWWLVGSEAFGTSTAKTDLRQ